MSALSCSLEIPQLTYSYVSIVGVMFSHVVLLQVVQKSGRVIGSCELTVASDRVDVSRLNVAVLSGLSLSVSTKADFPGALSVHVVKTHMMHRRYQVISVVFNTYLSSDILNST